MRTITLQSKRSFYMNDSLISFEIFFLCRVYSMKILTARHGSYYSGTLQLSKRVTFHVSNSLFYLIL